MDLNHDKQIQSLLCYRYTIGQTGGGKIELCNMQSSHYLSMGMTASVTGRRTKEKWQRTGHTPKRYRATQGCIESETFWSAASPLPLLGKSLKAAEILNGNHYLALRTSHFALS